MSCCNFDNDILFEKIKNLEKNVKKFEREQNKTNAEIYTLLKQSGVDLSQYYALNEEDYTKVLTSEDDINTLEPGTYKIVKTDMPQNAPKGITSSDYDGTLIQSNSYAILFENGYLHIGSFFSAMNRFRWNYVINSNLINIHLKYYMLISRYSDGEFIDDIHILNQNLTGVFIVNSTTQNLPVQQNGIIISRIGTATNSLFVTFIPEDSFDVYHCAKKSDGTWTEWEQVAFLSNLPNLSENAWLTNNYVSSINLNTITTPKSVSYPPNTSGAPTANRGFYVASNIADNRLIELAIEGGSGQVYTRQYINSIHSSWKPLAFKSDIPSLDGYATETWVNQQIQDITGGSVTADWVKSNFYPLTASQYYTINEATAFSDLKIGITVINSNNITDKSPIIPNNVTLIILKRNTTNEYYTHLIFDATNFNYYQTNSANTSTKRFAYSNEIPSLKGYATQAWVQSQNYLTKIPDEYATDTEVTQAITAALVGYATQAWVNEQISEITGGAVTTDIVAQMISDSLNGYATQTWVTGREYQTAAQVSAAITAAITGYATEQYVNKNYLAIESTLYSDIPENADLNDYTTPGNYFCSTSVKARTLKNTPKGLNYAFKLTYEEITANNQAVQKIVENATGNEYIRVKVSDSWGDWEKVALMTDIPSLSGYASQEWVQQQGYQTVQQVNSLINTATADMLTQADLDTFNYATENWVLQTALAGYAKTTIDDSLATRPSQEFDRFMIRSTDYHGVNAVSGAEGYLVMHMAVDPDAPTKFIRSSGIVVNNTYVNTFTTSDENSVGLSTNNQGTVTVVGMSNNAKQMFILVKPDNME